MRNKWFTASTIGAMAAAAAVTATTAAAAVAADSSTGGVLPSVSVEVTDYVHLPSAELAKAQALVTASYRAVGINMVWSTDVRSEPTIGVRVVIIPRAMTQKKCDDERISDAATGIAVSGAPDGPGRIAYIFYDRIERAALGEGAPVFRGLGHVIAHEIGHLLLGENSHVEQGLMRPNWIPRETHLLTLTESQVRQVWQRFAVTGLSDPQRASVRPSS
jgi:hypothetical protein